MNAHFCDLYRIQFQSIFIGNYSRNTNIFNTLKSLYETTFLEDNYNIMFYRFEFLLY